MIRTMSQPEITRRGRRTRSESGGSFTVVGRDEFVATSRHAATVDVEAFRADQDALVDQEPTDPYQR